MGLDVREITTESDPVELEPDARVMHVLEVNGNVNLRVGRQGDPFPAKEGMRYCDPQQIKSLLVSSPEGGGQTVTLAFTNDIDLQVEPTSLKNSISDRSPFRIQGSLAPNSVITAGQDATEVIDVQGADIVRMRVLARGMSEFSQAGTQDPIGMGLAVVDNQTGDPPFAMTTEYLSVADGTLQLIDLTDPRNLSSLDLVIEAGINEAYDVAYIAEHEQAVVLAHDGADMNLYRYDVSDPTAVALVDTTTIHGGVNNSRLVHTLEVIEGLGANPLVVALTNSSRLNTLEVTAAAAGNVTLIDTATASYQNFAVDPVDGFIFARRVGLNDDLHILGINESGFLSGILTLGAFDGSPESVAVDTVNKRLFALGYRAGDGDDSLGIWDYSSLPGVPTLLARHKEIDGVTMSGRNATAAVNEDGGLLILSLQTNPDVRLVRVTDPDNVKILGGATIPSRGAAFYRDPTGRDWSIIANDSANVQAWNIESGSDKVTLIPLLSNEERSGTGRGELIGISDGEERLVDLDIIGAAKLEILYNANGPGDSTIEFIEVGLE